MTNGWSMGISDVILNANDLIAGANQFNPPPAPGYQFVMVAVGAIYNGAGSDTFSARYSFRAVGQSGVGYSTFQDSCGIVPDPFPASDVFTGGEIVGWICWQVKVEDVDSLVAYYDLASGPTFFSLRKP